MAYDSYFNNGILSLQKFLTGAYIEKITFDEDLNPTFKKELLPDSLKYCFSATLHTDKGLCKMSTALSEEGLDTFMLEFDVPIKTTTSEYFVRSKVNKVVTEIGPYSQIYKVNIELDDNEVIFYAAEVYDKAGGKVQVKVNDEMILFIGSKSDAEKLEAIIDYA